MVAMAVLGLMAVMMLSLTSSAQKVAKQMSSRTEQFREGRRAFERINQRLSQATLNPYWDYVNAAGNPRTAANATTFIPNKYFRISELRYLQTNAAALPAPRGGSLAGTSVFFQAPLGKTDEAGLSGLNSLLNTVGFFIERGDDSTLRPGTVSAAKTRHRLYELTEPAEDLTIYSLTSGNAGNNSGAWYTDPLATAAYSRPLADNIVALLFEARYLTSAGVGTNSVATNSVIYSSAPLGNNTQRPEENNLPPQVRVTMVAVDEVSARRIEELGLALIDATNGATLANLEEQLTSNRLNFRRFESNVSIGPAKWSAQ